MLVMQGYFEKNTFHPDTEIPIPQKKKVFVAFSDEPAETEAERIRQQLAAVKEFSTGIRNDPQKLTSIYDETIAEGLHFGEPNLK
jgi:hypothetical protein